ncbi:GTP pyrophosphokinase [Achromobacter insolitus]|uniref:GTP pyrophosphokinase n=1 Tax=Achromobacter insolitus TaxID=217204 RepID=UPI00241E29F6|nr:RelA/SpoT domain-containing protein [Achromobacter insolitus]
MTEKELHQEYEFRYQAILQPIAERLSAHVLDNLQGIPRIDRVTARAKSPDRFLAKAVKALEDGGPKYSHPFEQIQDLVGARIIVFYAHDVQVVADTVERYYRHIERKDLIPESEAEFGYFGKHFILSMPVDVIEDDAHRDKIPNFFELQIKTLFQHAWSEANHDLAYKPEEPLTPLQKRQVAFTAAQAWGADQMFAQLHSELNGTT